MTEHRLLFDAAFHEQKLMMIYIGDTLQDIHKTAGILALQFDVKYCFGL
jgi:hypothetical protein